MVKTQKTSFKSHKFKLNPKNSKQSVRFTASSSSPTEYDFRKISPSTGSPVRFHSKHNLVSLFDETSQVADASRWQNVVFMRKDLTPSNSEFTLDSNDHNLSLNKIIDCALNSDSSETNHNLLINKLVYEHVMHGPDTSPFDDNLSKGDTVAICDAFRHREDQTDIGIQSTKNISLKNNCNTTLYNTDFTNSIRESRSDSFLNFKDTIKKKSHRNQLRESNSYDYNNKLVIKLKDSNFEILLYCRKCGKYHECTCKHKENYKRIQPKRMLCKNINLDQSLIIENGKESSDLYNLDNNFPKLIIKHDDKYLQPYRDINNSFVLSRLYIDSVSTKGNLLGEETVQLDNIGALLTDEASENMPTSQLSTTNANSLLSSDLTILHYNNTKQRKKYSKYTDIEKPTIQTQDMNISIYDSSRSDNWKPSWTSQTTPDINVARPLMTSLLQKHTTKNCRLCRVHQINSSVYTMSNQNSDFPLGMCEKSCGCGKVGKCLEEVFCEKKHIWCPDKKRQKPNKYHKHTESYQDEVKPETKESIKILFKRDFKDTGTSNNIVLEKREFTDKNTMEDKKVLVKPFDSIKESKRSQATDHNNRNTLNNLVSARKVFTEKKTMEDKKIAAKPFHNINESKRIETTGQSNRKSVEQNQRRTINQRDQRTDQRDVSSSFENKQKIKTKRKTNQTETNKRRDTSLSVENQLSRKRYQINEQTSAGVICFCKSNQADENMTTIDYTQESIQNRKFYHINEIPSLPSKGHKDISSQNMQESKVNQEKQIKSPEIIRSKVCLCCPRRYQKFKDFVEDEDLDFCYMKWSKEKDIRTSSKSNQCDKMLPSFKSTQEGQQTRKSQITQKPSILLRKQRRQAKQSVDISSTIENNRRDVIKSDKITKYTPRSTGNIKQHKTNQTIEKSSSDIKQKEQSSLDGTKSSSSLLYNMQKGKQSRNLSREKEIELKEVRGKIACKCVEDKDSEFRYIEWIKQKGKQIYDRIMSSLCSCSNLNQFDEMSQERKKSTKEQLTQKPSLLGRKQSIQAKQREDNMSTFESKQANKESQTSKQIKAITSADKYKETLENKKSRHKNQVGEIPSSFDIMQKGSDIIKSHIIVTKNSDQSKEFLKQSKANKINETSSTDIKQSKKDKDKIKSSSSSSHNIQESKRRRKLIQEKPVESTEIVGKKKCICGQNRCQIFKKAVDDQDSEFCHTAWSKRKANELTKHKEIEEYDNNWENYNKQSNFKELRENSKRSVIKFEPKENKKVGTKLKRAWNRFRESKCECMEDVHSSNANEHSKTRGKKRRLPKSSCECMEKIQPSNINDQAKKHDKKTRVPKSKCECMENIHPSKENKHNKTRGIKNKLPKSNCECMENIPTSNAIEHSKSYRKKNFEEISTERVFRECNCENIENIQPSNAKENNKNYKQGNRFRECYCENMENIRSSNSNYFNTKMDTVSSATSKSSHTKRMTFLTKDIQVPAKGFRSAQTLFEKQQHVTKMANTNNITSKNIKEIDITTNSEREMFNTYFEDIFNLSKKNKDVPFLKKESYNQPNNRMPSKTVQTQSTYYKSIQTQDNKKENARRRKKSKYDTDYNDSNHSYLKLLLMSSLSSLISSRTKQQRRFIICKPDNFRSGLCIKKEKKPSRILRKKEGGRHCFALRTRKNPFFHVNPTESKNKANPRNKYSALTCIFGFKKDIKKGPNKYLASSKYSHPTGMIPCNPKKSCNKILFIRDSCMTLSDKYPPCYSWKPVAKKTIKEFKHLKLIQAESTQTLEKRYKEKQPSEPSTLHREESCLYKPVLNNHKEIYSNGLSRIFHRGTVRNLNKDKSNILLIYKNSLINLVHKKKRKKIQSVIKEIYPITRHIPPKLGKSQFSNYYEYPRKRQQLRYLCDEKLPKQSRMMSNYYINNNNVQNKNVKVGFGINMKSKFARGLKALLGRRGNKNKNTSETKTRNPKTDAPSNNKAKHVITKCYSNKLKSKGSQSKIYYRPKYKTAHTSKSYSESHIIDKNKSKKSQTPVPRKVSRKSKRSQYHTGHNVTLNDLHVQMMKCDFNRSRGDFPETSRQERKTAEKNVILRNPAKPHGVLCMSKPMSDLYRDDQPKSKSKASVAPEFLTSKLILSRENYDPSRLRHFSKRVNKFNTFYGDHVMLKHDKTKSNQSQTSKVSRNKIMQTKHRYFVTSQTKNKKKKYIGSVLSEKLEAKQKFLPPHNLAMIKRKESSFRKSKIPKNKKTQTEKIRQICSQITTREHTPNNWNSGNPKDRKSKETYIDKALKRKEKSLKRQARTNSRYGKSNNHYQSLHRQSSNLSLSRTQSYLANNDKSRKSMTPKFNQNNPDSLTPRRLKQYAGPDGDVAKSYRYPHNQWDDLEPCPSTLTKGKAKDVMSNSIYRRIKPTLERDQLCKLCNRNLCRFSKKSARKKTICSCYVSSSEPYTQSSACKSHLRKNMWQYHDDYCNKLFKQRHEDFIFNNDFKQISKFGPCVFLSLCKEACGCLFLALASCVSCCLPVVLLCCRVF